MFLLVPELNIFLPVSWTNITMVFAGPLPWALPPHAPSMPLPDCLSHGLNGKIVGMTSSAERKKCLHMTVKNERIG